METLSARLSEARLVAMLSRNRRDDCVRASIDETDSQEEEEEEEDDGDDDIVVVVVVVDDENDAAAGSNEDDDADDEDVAGDRADDCADGGSVDVTLTSVAPIVIALSVADDDARVRDDAVGEGERERECERGVTTVEVGCDDGAEPVARERGS